MFLGLDISKATFDAALIKDENKPRHKRFANTEAGHRQLAAWLEDNGVTKVHACLEATGTYGEALALFLIEQGHTVSVVNPAAIHAFAKSELSRTKTDKADAQRIAKFCQQKRPPAWTPPAAELRELQALVRRLDALLQMRQMEKNRLQAGIPTAAVKASLEATLSFLEEQILQVKKRIQAHIEQHPTLKAGRDLLTSIPGIGAETAAALLAELGDVTQFKGARQVAAFAGLVPRLRESGTYKGHVCLSKLGSSRLRKMLYFPAVVALRFNAVLKAFGERLLSRGKSKMSVLGAVMRKLLHIAYGVLKSGKPFDPLLAKTA
jgi:transposase